MKIPEILLVESQHRPGSLASVLQVIGDCGLTVEHLNAVRRDQDMSVWEITLEMEEDLASDVYARIDALPNARLLGKSDRVFDRHRGGKIKMTTRAPIESLQQLRDIYTPGVARVCLALQDEPELAREFTYLKSAVAIITNGTAVLGLGNIGPLPSLPVMEGKAALHAQFVDLTAIPILVDAELPERFVEHVLAIESSFGAIHLEDISAPSCFDVETQLRHHLDKPVLHDDQHGTAVVALGALLKAAERVGTRLEDCVVGQIGLGAAGNGIARLILHYGVKRVLGTDLNPTLVNRFRDMGGEPAPLDQLMAKADIVIATTGRKNLIQPAMIRKGQMIFALSNPEPEIEPRTALERGAAFAVDGRGVNNVLGFPGLFRGALDAGAKCFTDAMLLAAAKEIAHQASGDGLVPDPLDADVHMAIAAAVAKAATHHQTTT